MAMTEASCAGHEVFAFVQSLGDAAEEPGALSSFGRGETAGQSYESWCGSQTGVVSLY